MAGAQVKEFMEFVRSSMTQLREDITKQELENEEFRRRIMNERLQWRQQFQDPQVQQQNQVMPQQAVTQPTQQVQQKAQRVMSRQYTGLHVIRAIEALIAALPIHPAAVHGIGPEQIYDAVMTGAARADQELSQQTPGPAQASNG